MDWSNCFATYNNTAIKDVATLACLPILFRNVLDAALAFAGTVAVIMIIFAGYKFVTSSGDPKKVDSARQTITFAIIGLLIIFLSFFIINFIAWLTSADCIKVFNFSGCGNIQPNKPQIGTTP